KEYKGLFLKFTAKAYNHADSLKVVYDLAEKALSPFDKALIISAPNLTATVAGETEITGDMLLTTKNIQMGRIFGIENASSDYHDGDIIVDGSIKAKAFDEAPLRNLFFDINKPVENASLIKGDFLLTESSLAQIGSMRNIFINGSLTISGSIQSSRYSNPLNITVSGGLIIEENSKCDLDMLIACSSKAYIKSGSDLSGMVISSLDTVEIMSKTAFKDCQIYSSSSIKMDESYFGYPSIIGIYVDASKQDKLDESLEINNSVINGSVLLVSTVTGLNTNKSIIKIDDKSYIQGLIYSENNSGIEGKVDGIIYTRNFYFYKDPTEYINWMVNLNVNRKNLDEHFLLPIGFANDAENMEILNVKWMY
ncbi:MAG TPA: hypothetical protein VHO28_01500, partial [Ignavibacteriales bacterium]|nr:hypothetical protein [Ignavibacteriales bacterium]